MREGDVMGTCAVEQRSSSSSYGDLSTVLWPCSSVEDGGSDSAVSGEQDELWKLSVAGGDYDVQGGFQGRKKRTCRGGGAAARGLGAERNVGGRGAGKVVVVGGSSGGGGGAAAAAACPRDRLQRHRVQVAGTVRIPEAWCGESRLREWVSSRDVEDALQPAGLISARAALISARAARIPPPSSAAATASLVPAPAPCEVSLLS